MYIVFLQTTSEVSVKSTHNTLGEAQNALTRLPKLDLPTYCYGITKGSVNSWHAAREARDLKYINAYGPDYITRRERDRAVKPNGNSRAYVPK